MRVFLQVLETACHKNTVGIYDVFVPLCQVVQPRKAPNFIQYKVHDIEKSGSQQLYQSRAVKGSASQARPQERNSRH